MSGSLSEYRPTIEEANGAYAVMTSYFESLGVDTYGAVGSFGRRTEGGLRCELSDRVGDVDIVVSDPDGKIGVRESLGLLFGYHKNGQPKSQGVIGRIQVDVWITDTKEEWYCTQLFFLLPRTLQIALRAIAAGRGYKFSCKGLFVRNDGDYYPVKIESQNDIYKKIGVVPFTEMDMLNAESYKGEEI